MKFKNNIFLNFIAAGIVCIILSLVVEAYGQKKLSRPKISHTQGQSYKSKPSKPGLSRQKPIKKLEGEVNGHEYVDLGLPSGTKWATCNLGDSLPLIGGGEYYLWEDIYDKRTLHNSINKSQDIVAILWGKEWRLPTKNECEELKNKCKWEEINDERFCGYRIIGPNGKHIYMYASGCERHSSVYDLGDYGYYWCTFIAKNQVSAYMLEFTMDYIEVFKADTDYYKYSIRPVLSR